jgi:hypothetical protein
VEGDHCAYLMTSNVPCGEPLVVYEPLMWVPKGETGR